MMAAGYESVDWDSEYVVCCWIVTVIDENTNWNVFIQNRLSEFPDRVQGRHVKMNPFNWVFGYSNFLQPVKQLLFAFSIPAACNSRELFILFNPFKLYAYYLQWLSYQMPPNLGECTILFLGCHLWWQRTHLVDWRDLCKEGNCFWANRMRVTIK